MLFTIYYVAATWIQSWRLNYLKNRVNEYLVRNASVVLYQVPEVDISSDASVEGGFTVQVPSVSSSYCINKDVAKLGDLLWNVGSKRVYSLFPKQIVDLSQWISFKDKGPSVFPINTDTDNTVEIDMENKIDVLIEAAFLDGQGPGEFAKIDSYGVLKAWKASAHFGLILETDMEHLARLGLCFLFGHPNIQDGMEIIRLETVSCSGYPCKLLNPDSIPMPRTIRQRPQENESGEEVDDGSMSRSSFTDIAAMSPMQWKSHIELLQNFSQAADETPSGEITLAADRSISVVPTSASPRRPEPSEALKDSLKALYNFKMDEDEIRLEVLKGITPSNGSSSKSPAKDVDAKKAEPKPNISLQDGALVVGEKPVAASSGPEPAKSISGSASTASAKSGSPKGPGSATTSSKGSTSAPQDEDAFLTRKCPAPPLPQGSSPQHGKKPPNILILCTGSQDVAVQSKEALEAALQKHKYVLYSTTQAEVCSRTPWADNTSMLFTHGRLNGDMVKPILNYMSGSNDGAEGGRVWCVCPGAEFLRLLLPCPAFSNAKDSLESKGVVSYKQWKGLKLPHCSLGVRASDVPPTLELAKSQGKFNVTLKVLATEDTSHEPVLLLISSQSGAGKILISMVKLGTGSGESEQKCLEVMNDLLSSHLGLSASSSPSVPSSVSSSPSSKGGQGATFTNGYFLGRHELKLEFLSSIKDRLKENVLPINGGGLSLKFCQSIADIPKSGATSSFLPVLLHTCPPKFSTVEYFENLQTESIGRLVIYSRILTSTMNVLSGPVLHHGLAVIATQQTEGKGRSSNVWLSPEGCGMFSLQLVLPDTSYLGRHAPLLQHIIALSVVSAINGIPGCEELDLRLKWPNDIYAGNSDKIGGVIVNSTSTKNSLVCNVGCGLNISNSVPTVCVNDLIKNQNKSKGIVANKDGKGVAPLTVEKVLARTFNQLEKLIDAVQSDKVDKVMKLYYDYWLHSDAEVRVSFPSGQTQSGIITGIDTFGFLQVKPSGSSSVFTVHPDGNSFDMLQGLIIPKK
ncbi:biotin--protein ligase isoform X2 [Ischnura elegans]|uniref:biotin--protein ligase isoform X2 n=1 Tax=Ischnura elegans TaxID=197161 RepID=UPI001ED8B422|nr:biotin--protein ligase isoform X2 [Ischnura elegans]